MEKKLILLFAILTIAVLVLAGCQGYKPPKYESNDNDSEDVDIDLSELDEENTDDEYVPYEGDEYADEEFDTSSDEQEYVPQEDTTPQDDYTYEQPQDNSYQEADYQTLDDYDSGASSAEDSDTGFVEAAYQPLNEDEADDASAVYVTEGETLKVNVNAHDLDGDRLTYVYTAPLNSMGEWRTRTGDQGVYYSTVTVSDGKTEVVRQVKIIVEPKNNKPVLDVADTITVDEGDIVKIYPSTFDADGERLTVSYSGWMTSDTKQTGYTDAGEHTVTVTVTDGISRVSKDITVIVNDVNRPPEVEIEATTD